MEQINVPWWKHDGDDLHKEVFKAVNNTRKNQMQWDALDERNFRLYSGLPLYSSFMSDSVMDVGDARFTMNVVQAGVNTLVSKISKNKVRPTYLTDEGDWGMQQEAKKLDRYVFGQFYKVKVYEESKKALRDALTFGDGFVKHWHDKHGNIHVKRVFKPSLLFDLAECMYSGVPKTVYEIRIVNKDTLKAKYPDFSKEIEASSLNDLPFFVDSVEANANLVAVVEGYRCAEAVEHEGKTQKNTKQTKDEQKLSYGRHFIGIANATFLDEEFKKEQIPYKKIPFVPNALGYLSKGVAELITGHQVEINRSLRRISRSMNLMSSPHVLVDYLSDIIDTHFNNEVGNIIKYKDRPPQVVFPAGVNPTVIDWFLLVYNKAFEEIGLSQLTAQSKKPEGLDSGKALREYNDIESERFAELAQNWETFHLEIADAIIEHSVEIAKEGGSPIALSPDKMGALKIDFSKIKLKDSDYVRQCFPSSMLPKTPWGKMQFVAEMSDRGWIDPHEAMGLLEFPDTSEMIENKTAHIDDIKYTAYLMIQDAEFVAPEPYQNLDYGLQYMNSMYLKMKTRKLPQDRLDLLQKWINDALALKQSMMEPPMPEMGALPPQDEQLSPDMTQGVA
jgi:hypothetical protein